MVFDSQYQGKESIFVYGQDKISQLVLVKKIIDRLGQIK